MTSGHHTVLKQWKSVGSLPRAEGVVTEGHEGENMRKDGIEEVRGGAPCGASPRVELGETGRSEVVLSSIRYTGHHT